jgi:molybdate-binding protein/transcriptional regulator with XRE-family HTH domain
MGAIVADSSGQRLRDLRVARAISQSELARRAQISRQALGAIEGGTYVPGVGVALKLAAELGTTVEYLFGHADDPQVVAEHPAGAAPAVNARVSLARVRGRLVAVPLPATCVTLTPASGLVTRTMPKRRVEVTQFRSRAEMEATLIIAGCDPGVAILRDYLSRRQPPIEVAAIRGTSRDALTAAAHGVAHAAGVHLRDPESGGYNLIAARAAFGGSRFRIVNFARWELGIASRPNGGLVKTLDDLARPDVTIVNRKVGSGARAVLDEMLTAGHVPPGQIRGYQQVAAGHLEVAAAIAAGAVDAGVTIRLAARLYDLHFEPWREERYDLVIPEEDFNATPVQTLLDALNSRTLANEIGHLCSYDTSQMGVVLAN